MEMGSGMAPSLSTFHVENNPAPAGGEVAKQRLMAIEAIGAIPQITVVKLIHLQCSSIIDDA
jgi:hypothetical protein